MFTEYIFENKKYELAVRDLKATLFDIVAIEEAKLSSIEEKIEEEYDPEKRQALQELCSQQDDCLRKVLMISNQLSEALVRLDSYSKGLKELENENIAGIIAEMGDKSVQKAYRKDLKQGQAMVNNIANGMISDVGELTDSESLQNEMVSSIETIKEGPMLDSSSIGDVQFVPDETGADDFSNEEVPMEEESEVGSDDVEEEEEAVDEVDSEVTSGDEGEVAEAADEADFEVASGDEGEAEVAEEEEAVEEADSEVAPGDEGEAEVAEEEEAVEEADSEVAPGDEGETEVTEEEEAIEEADSEVAPGDEGEAEVAEEEEAVEEADSEVALGDEGEAEVVEEEEAVEEADSEVALGDEGEAEVAEEEEAVEEVDSEVAPGDEGEAEVAEGEETVEEVAPEAIPSEGEAVATEGAVDIELPAAVIPNNDVVPDEAASVDEEKISETASSGGVLLEPMREDAQVQAPVSSNEGLLIPIVGQTDSTNDATLQVPASDNALGNLEAVVDKQAELNEENKAIAQDAQMNVVQKLKFIKSSNDVAKAILTNKKQITNLRRSRAVQESLLRVRGSIGSNVVASNTFAAVNNSLENEKAMEQQLINNGLLEASTVDKQKQIEQMLEQANALYKEGRVEEAQAMYDKISALNKELQQGSSMTK